MSPFADALRQLRLRRGLRQQALADLVGCERSYISALENDLKKEPPPAFVDGIGQVLDLPSEEAAELRQALAKSRRAYAVPAQAPRETYEFVYDLFASLDSLSLLQLQGLRTVLQLGNAQQGPLHESDVRIRRKDRRLEQKEVAM